MGVSSLSTAHKRGQDGPTVVSQSCWDGNRRLLPSTTSASRCCFREVSDIGVQDGASKRVVNNLDPTGDADAIPAPRRIPHHTPTQRRRLLHQRGQRARKPTHRRIPFHTIPGPRPQTISGRPEPAPATMRRLSPPAHAAPTPRDCDFAPPAPPRRGHVTNEITL